LQPSRFHRALTGTEMFAAAGTRYPELLDLVVSDALTGQRRL
jgi:hypothetical protein